MEDNKEQLEEQVEVKDLKEDIDEFRTIIKETVAEELKVAIPNLNEQIHKAINEELRKKVVITRRQEKVEEDKNAKYVEDTFNRIKNNLFK